MTTQPKERPILFSGATMKALLENRKTQMRRPLKTFLEGKVKDVTIIA